MMTSFTVKVQITWMYSDKNIIILLILGSIATVSSNLSKNTPRSRTRASAIVVPKMGLNTLTAHATLGKIP
jgi:hypothetical protein